MDAALGILVVLGVAGVAATALTKAEPPAGKPLLTETPAAPPATSQIAPKTELQALPQTAPQAAPQDAPQSALSPDERLRRQLQRGIETPEPKRWAKVAGKPQQLPTVQRVLSPAMHEFIGAGAGRIASHDFKDRDAFRKAVDSYRTSLFRDGINDEDVYAVTRRAFVAFAQQVGMFLFCEADTLGESARYDIVALTTGTDPDETAPIGLNFGTLAERYVELRRFVSEPYLAHKDKGKNDAVRRFQLWRQGWQPGDGYKELTIVQRILINPMLIGTKNWPKFLHRSVQYTMMDVLWAVFWKVAQDLQTVPLAWNRDQSANVDRIMNQYLAAIRGSAKTSWQVKRQETAFLAVTAIADIIKAVLSFNPGKIAGILGRGGMRFAAFKRAGGNVQIDEAIGQQVARRWLAVIGTDNAPDVAGMSVVVRAVFDDMAAFVAALMEIRDSAMPAPKYLMGGAFIRDKT